MVAQRPASRRPRILATSVAMALAISAAACGGGGGVEPPRPPGTITYAANPATYTRGAAIAPNQPTVAGGAPTSWTISPALPAGLTLSAATGIVSGTPTAVTADTSHTVTAANAAGQSTVALRIAVTEAAPAGLTYGRNPATYPRGTPIAPNVPTVGGGTPTAWAVSPALPAGLRLDAASGWIEGTPTEPTLQATYRVTATNASGSASVDLVVTVTEVAPANLVYSTNPASYVRGVAITPNDPSWDGGTPTAFAVTPALPAGLSLDAASGRIQGTPAASSAPAEYSVTASNGVGSTRASVSIAVVDGTVISVSVSPSTGDVVAGGAPLPLAARATFSDSTTGDVTAEATWSTDAAGNLDVSGGGAALAPASARVGASGQATASYRGRSGSATLRVVRGPPIGPLLANDPLAGQQWYLRNDAQAAYADSVGTRGEDLRLSTAHALGLTGEGVKVAVVDTGLQIAHPDLEANVVEGSWNFVDDTADPSPSLADANGDHGTSVSGIIGMVYGNAVGGMGIAPGVDLNGYNFLEDQSLASLARSLGGSASSPASSDVWVFNQSFGSSSLFPSSISPSIEDQYRAGVTTLRDGKGAVYVRSAGNGFRGYGPSVDVQADCADAKALGTSCQNPSMDGTRSHFYNVVVAALNANGLRSTYSSAGSAIWVSGMGGEYGYNASVAGGTYPAYAYAPAMVTVDRTGCAVGYARAGAGTSAFNEGTSPNGSCDYTNTFNGTSSAAPSAVGAIALLLDARPDLTWRDVKHVLATTARRVDPSIAAATVELSDGTYIAESPWLQNAAGRWFHNWYGFGAIDVDAAVRFLQTYEANSLGSFVDTGFIPSGSGLGLPIPDGARAGATATLAVSPALTVESVQVKVAITHPRPSDLGIELTSPSGTRSILLNIRNGFADASGLQMVLTSSMFYGEPAAGTWTLRVVDGRAGGVGTLDQWYVRVVGH